MHRSHLGRPVSRRVVVGVALTLALALAAVAPLAAGAAYPVFTLTGRGHGHGIGLSQYGAKGFADHGWTGEQIATYYFPGSSILTAAEKTISVNLDPAASYATGGNAGYTNTTWHLFPGYVTSTLVVNGAAVLDNDHAPYAFTASGSTITVTDKSGTVVGGPYSGAVSVTSGVGGTSPALIKVQEGTGNYDSGWIRYRGSMVLTPSNSKIELVNKLAMSEYLYGVVPRESPSSWNIEALKAQAIVARSYATAGAPAKLYTDTRSQAYCGYANESKGVISYNEAASSNTAVDATVGKFVGVGGAIIRTYFSSSSGGHSANIEDVWKGSAPLSYYRGVDDPYSVEPGSDPWTPAVTLDGKTIADKIGRPAGSAGGSYVTGLTLNRAAGDFVRTIDVTYSDGKTANIWGDTFRSKLGLKSTKFFIGVPTSRIAYGDRYSTAVAVSASLYPSGSTPKAVVIANGTDAKFPDALTASGLAGVAGGPVLMTKGKVIDPGTLDEIKRLKALGASKVYIVGGPASVLPAVQAQLTSVMGNAAAVERLAGNARYGTNRYGTAATVAMKMKALGADGSKVLIASGEKWTDAAVASSVSAASGRPVVLVSAGYLPDGSKAVLADLGAKETAVFGGPATIGNVALAQTLAATGEKAPARRFGTSGTRYDVAVAAAQWCVESFGYTLDSAFISTGEKFPDSVTGGVLAAKAKRPLLLTATNSASGATVNYLSANRATVNSLSVIGGTASVAEKVAQALAMAAN